MTLEVVEETLSLTVTEEDSVLLVTESVVNVLEVGIAGPQGPPGMVLIGLEAERPDPSAVDEGTQYLATDTDKFYIAV